MIASRLMLVPVWFSFSLATQASCLQSDPAQVSAMAQKSKAAINTLYEHEKARIGGQPSRSLVLLAVHLASEGKLDARSVEYFNRYVQDHPHNHFPNLEKTSLRAAESLKRGFFLIDGAVDSDPKNWRLRYLRMRMDAFVPAELGRYVVALKDASLLTENIDQLPAGLRPFVSVLRLSALDRSGKTAVAASDYAVVRKQFQGTQMAALSSPCGLQTFVADEEIDALLNYALRHNK